MGYTTTFNGRFNLDRELEQAHYVSLLKFSETRHEDRDEMPSYPGIWCDWAPTEDGMGIEWNGAEKFYDYVEWLQYIIDNFIKHWGYVLNGEVTWEGEGSGDLGKIIVKDNVVTHKRGRIVY